MFQPDNFSSSQIEYTEIPVIPDFVFAVMKCYFKECTVEKVLWLDQPQVNSKNYQVVVSLAGSRKTFLLRKFKILTDHEQIHFYLNLLPILKEHHVPVSTVVKTISGEETALVAGEVYCLYDFIAARYFVPDEKLFRSVAESIAKMHVAFNQLDQAVDEKVKKYSSFSPVYYNEKPYSADEFVKFCSIISEQKTVTDGEKQLLASLDIIKKVAADVEKNKQRIEKLPKQIIHSDLHPHNILIDGTAVKAIIDFDSIRVSQQARDVATALYRFGRQFLVNVENPSVTLGKHIGDIFLRAYSSVRPLSSEEVELLPLLVQDDFLSKLIFVARGIYVDHNNDWVSDLPKFLKIFQECHYFWP